MLVQDDLHAHKGEETWCSGYVINSSFFDWMSAQLFSHEIVDLERTLRFLLNYKNSTPPAQPQSEFVVGKEESDDEYHWEIPYTLLLWLSIVVLVPFNLSTLEAEDTGLGLLDTVVSVCKEFLADSGRTKDVAAMLLANLLSR